MPRTVKTVIMSCLHTLQFEDPIPKIGEYVLCFRCDAYRRAVVPPDSYRVECRDCSKAPTRDYGSAKLRAEVDADKHARKLPGHRVTVLNGDRLVSERMHEPAPTFADVPPF